MFYTAHSYPISSTQWGVKNLLPLYNAFGNFHNQTNALQHICDVVYTPFLPNSQDPDSLKEHQKNDPRIMI